MNIAFISYEYPPDTSYGGIATYVYQVARLLHQRGHHVEVFAGSCDRTGTVDEDGIQVHRVMERNHKDYFRPAGQRFAHRHAVIKFDVLEGPELLAEAREAVRLVPDIPLVVKLHSPSLLLWKMNHCQYAQPAFPKNIRSYLSTRLRGGKPYWAGCFTSLKPPSTIKAIDELERSHVLQADEITAPSQAIRTKVMEDWDIEDRPIHIIPNPFVCSAPLFSIPVETHTNVVTFVGRLEVRKGVLDLARAIPGILRGHTDITVRFVGGNHISDRLGNMRHYLENILLRQYRQSVQFIDEVPAIDIPKIFASTDICVFPSLWDNFPSVCLEAMAAARGIVGTQSGGMYDLLAAGRVGQLIPPQDPEKLTEAVVELLKNPDLRMQLGQAARTRLLTEYSAERIGTLLEASYHRAIARRKCLGKRQG
jgi:glycosyltransferase involved in cell wall biosynthesis